MCLCVWCEQNRTADSPPQPSLVIGCWWHHYSIHPISPSLSSLQTFLCPDLGLQPVTLTQTYTSCWTYSLLALKNGNIYISMHKIPWKKGISSTKLFTLLIKKNEYFNNISIYMLSVVCTTHIPECKQARGCVPHTAQKTQLKHIFWMCWIHVQNMLLKPE